MTREDILKDPSKSYEEMAKKYPPRSVYNRASFGFKKSTEKYRIQEIDYPTIAILDKGMDYLDEGKSFREIAEWMNSLLLDTEDSITHMGLKQIWYRERPDSPMQVGRKKVVARQIKKKNKLTRQERLERNRRLKISHEKRKITYAKKKIDRIAEEIDEIKEYKKTNVVELDYSVIDTSSVQEEIEKVKPIFEPNPGPQTEFLRSSQLEVLYGGAAGGGKSYALLADPMRYFGSKHFNGLLLRKTNDALRELIWKSKELYPQAYPGAEFREKDKEWRFPGGGKLWMTFVESDDDVLRYQGQAFTWIGFDELTQYSTPFAWNYLRSRLRSADPEMSKHLAMRATTNPGGPGHGWVKRMFVDPAPANKAFWATDIETGQTIVFPPSHERAGQPLFKRKFIPATLYDNPYLANDGMYEANLLALSEQQRRQLLEGDWNVADGAAFSEFRENIHTCEPFEIPHTWRRFRSCDYGYSSHTAVHWYAVDPDGVLYVYRELYVSKKEANELAQLVLEVEKGEKIDYGVLDSSLWSKRGDPGPSIAERMIRAGCKWRPSDRSAGSRVQGRNRLHELLKVHDYGNEIKKPGIIFFNTCRQIISDLPVIPSDPKGSDDIDIRYASDHAYDSIRYGIMTRPRPGSPWESMERMKKSEYNQPASEFFGY